MRLDNSFGHSTVFTGPATPAALCLQLIRLKQPVTRTFLVDHLDHSQPTITRAVLALIDNQIIQERPDKTVTTGPGRPKVPVEMAPTPWALIGVAIGTKSTYLGVYGTRGQLLREQFIEIYPAELTISSFITELITHINTMVSDAKLPLANLGISTSGIVDDQKLITAANLGWDHVDIVAPFEQALGVPVTLSSVIEAIASAEQQSQMPPRPLPPRGKTQASKKKIVRGPRSKDHRGLVFYVDDSVGAAIHTHNHVMLIEVGNYYDLEGAALDLAARTSANTLVLAGSAFENSVEAHAVGRAFRSSEHSKVEIRVIPTHIDNARAAARAVAVARFLTDPIAFAKQLEAAADYYSI